MNATCRGFVECLDHVKYVVGWTIMVSHVYDPTYCKMMTIVVCDM
jgi:hypothetical protein